MIELALPSVLRYPLVTPWAKIEAEVASGAHVRHGDIIANGLHAAASGEVELTESEILLHPDGRDDRAPPITSTDLVECIRQAGIVGLGGAGYPTHLKVDQALAKRARTLIVNAVECEPGVSADKELLAAHLDEVLAGIATLERALGGTRTILATAQPLAGIEAIDAEVAVVVNGYPTGAERTLIKHLLDIEVPKNAYPTDVGVVVLNVATVFAIQRAWSGGERLTRRVTTVGQTNLLLRIGHPIDELPLPTGAKVVGGPVTGWPASINAAIGKTTRSVTLKSTAASSPCIRCGWCASACPEQLLPQELFRQINAEQWPDLQRLRLGDCVECGACDLACPSRLPLLATFRFATSARLEADGKRRDATLARDRCDQRNARIALRHLDSLSKREARLATPHEWTRRSR